MKALLIDCEYFCYPEGVENFSSLNKFINENYNSFVSMNKLSSDRTVPPFFVDEYTTMAYLNVSQIDMIEEVNVTVMSKEDYKTSLNNAIDETCIACDSFDQRTRCCDCGEIQNNLCLNGKCDVFTLAEDDYL